MHLSNYQRHTPHRLSEAINNYHATIQNQNNSFVQIPGGQLSKIAEFLSYQDQVHLASTCKSLLTETHYFSIDTIKHNFENDVANYLAPFKNEDNTFKPIDMIQAGIIDETITLPEDKLIFKEVFNRVLSRRFYVDKIGGFIRSIKGTVSNNQLVELTSTALTKMSNDHCSWEFIVGIKDTVSPDQLYKLASTAINKMSNEFYIKMLISSIKDKLSPDQLENLNTQIKLKKCLIIMRL